MGALSLAAALGLIVIALPLPAAAVCEADDGGLALAPGFCASVFADEVGAVRNLVVSPGGDVFASVRASGGGVLALRDSDGDGRADIRTRFGPDEGHGIAFHAGHLYLAARERLVRWPWSAGQLEPDGEAEIVVDGFQAQSSHSVKGLAIAADGALYVSIGAPSNACQREPRTPRSPGLDPCPQRRSHAGIWRFSADTLGQRPGREARFASGLRHTLAMAVHPHTGALWGAVNGRDQLGQLWGYDDERNAELPAEELVEIGKGQDFGWPYCYMDGLSGRKVLAPEYGGDGQTRGRCSDAALPAIAFPAHWAPMALAFATPELAVSLPEDYRDGAFLAFRGSWNRAPLPQQGYRVVFAPFRDGRPTGDYHTFATGRASPTATRMTGVALAPDGALYLASDASGTVWRVEPTAPDASR